MSSSDVVYVDDLRVVVDEQSFTGCVGDEYFAGDFSFAISRSHIEVVGLELFNVGGRWPAAVSDSSILSAFESALNRVLSNKYDEFWNLECSKAEARAEQMLEDLGREE